MINNSNNNNKLGRDVEWIHPAHYRDQWRALVNTEMIFRNPKNVENFMSGWATAGFSRRTELLKLGLPGWEEGALKALPMTFCLLSCRYGSVWYLPFWNARYLLLYKWYARACAFNIVCPAKYVPTPEAEIFGAYPKPATLSPYPSTALVGSFNVNHNLTCETFEVIALIYIFWVLNECVAKNEINKCPCCE
jgi:hypothetical protein